MMKKKLSAIGFVHVKAAHKHVDEIDHWFLTTVYTSV